MPCQRIADRIFGRLKKEKEAVTLVNLTSTPLPQKIAGDPVMHLPEPASGLVAEALGDAGAINEIGQQDDMC
jgi:hypothetical protein